MHEDAAAERVARACTAPAGEDGIWLAQGAPFTGRANLYAEADGLLVYDAAALERLNAVDESLTIAALPPFTRIAPKQMAATVKVIPFAAPAAVVERVETAARDGAPLLRVAPLTARRVALVQTRVHGTKESVLDKTVEATRRRVESLGSRLVAERRCAHETETLAADLAAATAEADIVLVVGASAIVDRGDVVPAAVAAAGGEAGLLGAPVDPGNLLYLSHIARVPVLAGPGSVRSPKESAFDWVLARLCAGLAVTRADLVRMGAGGLLKEIPSRPQPRAAEPPPQAASSPEQPEAATPRIAGLLLAAGSSRRMGDVNKLIAPVAGRPMVAHAARALSESRASDLTVVTGHDSAAVRAALAEFDAVFVDNPDHPDGLSTSLKRGIAALPAEADGVVVCLGDMPRLSADTIDRLIAAFDPAAGKAIAIPTQGGQRGNPVLFARRFFAEIQELAGDVGARSLIAAYPDQVVEVPVEDPAIFLDVDDAAALARLDGG